MDKSQLIEQVKRTILQYNLIANGDFLLVAVSGGADSVCLLDVLYELKSTFSITLAAAHVNHMLRSDESERDEAFVRQLCAQYQIPFYCERIDVAHLSKELGLTCEEAGRTARYDFFLRLKSKLACDKIATAHNENDNIETVCMRFLRGTGLKGLSGIPIQNDRCVIRPLLHTLRRDIEAYLNEKQIAYVTDSSNLSNDYTRNRIRHYFLPNITKYYNENFVETLSENIILYQEAEQYLNKRINAAFNAMVQKHDYGYRFYLAELLCEDVYMIKSLIKKGLEALSATHLPSKTIQLIYQNVVIGSCNSFQVNENLTVYKRYDSLYIATKKTVPSFCYQIHGTGELFLSETGDQLHFSEGGEAVPHTTKHSICIKKSLCKGKTFTVRNRLPGDKIFLGSCGHKRLKKLLIDEKIPLFLRNEIPILLLENEIVWVCGVRDNPNFRAQPGDTYIKITYLKEKKYE